MTVVITVITQDHVMQACDRRLVWLDADGGTRPRADNSNKAVLFANRMVFAYTGIADIGPHRQKTDLWLSEQLAGTQRESQDGVLDALADATSERLHHGRVQRLPRAWRGHEFAAGGWARFIRSSEPASFRPYLALVTNLRDARGEPLEAPADDCVVLHQDLLPGQQGRFCVSGQQFEPNARRELEKDLGSAVGVPRRMADVLVGHIRRFAETNSTVGRGVLLNSLPRAAVVPADQGMLVLAAPPLANAPTFFSVSPDSNDPVQYGPIAVAAGGGIVSGFTGGPVGSIPGFPR